VNRCCEESGFKQVGGKCDEFYVLIDVHILPVDIFARVKGSIREAVLKRNLNLGVALPHPSFVPRYGPQINTTPSLPESYLMVIRASHKTSFGVILAGVVAASV
jgi:hypothetical protein